MRNYLNAQVWDGKPRLEPWLTTYFGAEATDYTRAIGSRWLIQAVARIFEPGCQADYILILEGPQGRLKSTSLRTLAVNPEWYTGRISQIGSKEALIEIGGVWFIEDAEMVTLNRAASGASKQFITEPTDRYRPPYGRHTIRKPRSCVFVATINPPAGGYLKDPTGARRYWPVVCDTIDRDGLERDRDQLWAEAVHLYRAEHPRYLETAELEALARAEQDARRIVDAWEGPVRSWVGHRRNIGRLETVTKGALGIAPQDQTPSIQRRVVAILTSLGFTKCRPRTGKGKREHHYTRAPAQKVTTNRDDQ